MTTFTEGKHPGEGLLSEAPRARSRDKATIKSGSGVIQPGTILGQITAGAASSAAKSGGNTGNGTLTLDAVTPVLAGAKTGVYRVRFAIAAANNGTFVVTDPDGLQIGTVVMAAGAGAFSNGIKLAIADGASDFVVGDGFDITVAVGSLKWAPSPNALTAGIEGAEVARAVAIYGADATSADVDIAILARDAEWRIGALVYDATVDDNAKKAIKRAQLAAAGIIAR